MSLETMTEALYRLENEGGYILAFRAEGAGVRCSECDHWHDAAHIVIDEIVRFEGESDPADEAILFALSCDECGAKGTYVAAYGPSMEADDVELIRGLTDRRRRQ